jgi:hypothetical protein
VHSHVAEQLRQRAKMLDADGRSPVGPSCTRGAAWPSPDVARAGVAPACGFARQRRDGSATLFRNLSPS